MGRRNRGFTLLELLVVMLIIGLVAGVATLSLGDGGGAQRLRQEALRLQQLIALAQEESVLRQREYGIYFDPGGYRFMYLDGADWRELGDAGLYRARRLPPPLQLELWVENRAQSLHGDGGPPQVVVFSSGESTPFECRLADAHSAYHLSGQLNGHLELQAESDGAR